MTGRLIPKVMRTSLPKNLGGLLSTFRGKNKNTLLTKHLLCVNNVNLSNNLHTSPFFFVFSRRILNSESEHRERTFDKTLSTTSVLTLTNELQSKVTKVNMGSILEHQKYKEMKSKLSKRNRKSLGPLDTASLYILSSKNLTVNLDILISKVNPYGVCRLANN